MIYISGPGHGGQAVVANDYIDGSYAHMYPEFKEGDETSLKNYLNNLAFQVE